MVWYGMVRYGMAWYGMTWYGVARYGKAWHAVVWHGMTWPARALLGMASQITSSIALQLRPAYRVRHKGTARKAKKYRGQEKQKAAGGKIAAPRGRCEEGKSTTAQHSTATTQRDTTTHNTADDTT